MLKTTRSSNELTPKKFRADDNKVVSDSRSRANKMVVNLSKNNKSRNLTYIPNIGAMREPNFLNPNAKKAFNYLRLAFIEAPIFQYFDLKVISELKLMN